jgi:hypothetical protein
MKHFRREWGCCVLFRRYDMNVCNVYPTQFDQLHLYGSVFYSEISSSLWDPMFADVPQTWILKKKNTTFCAFLLLLRISVQTAILFFYFKHSPWSECYILCFGWFPGAWIFMRRRFGTLCSILLPAHTIYENVTERVFRNVGTCNSDAGVSPKRKNTTAIIFLCMFNRYVFRRSLRNKK